MRRAFTLIELLVVIAIIAILAAILFPVFAQAKVAGKKTVSISNCKQQTLGLMLYVGDFDDTWPRNDACQLYSSLNPAHYSAAQNSSPLQGCTNPYYNRVNHFSWQKWPQPYVKNVGIFETPLRQKDAFQWNTNGEMFNQFLLNTGLTGGIDVNLNTGVPLASRGKRNSWLGGITTAVPSPAEALIIMEVTLNNAVIPTATDDTQWNTATGDIVAYPMAFREYWKNKFNKTPRGVTDCLAGTVSDEVDTNKAVTGGVTIGFVDGHAKFMKTGEFLAKSPSKTEMIPGTTTAATSGYTYQNDCHGMPNGGGTAGTVGILRPRTDINYPLWALGF